MYFYVDESGQTGTNLFDSSQPILYYGVLSSKVNLDILAQQKLVQLRNRLGVDRLHATKLGNEGLIKIAPELLRLVKENRLSFDFFSVVKADHAAICFFDQVFDQGLNPAVTWSGYWTPLRYVLLLKVSYLFDEDALKKAWSARIELDDKKAEADLVDVCKVIRSRIDHLPDQRSRQLIGDALQWVIDNPNKIHYNAESGGSLLQISPNLIGFQSVMFGIASHIIKHGRLASRITVDQQLQFNNAQKILADFYATAPREFFSSTIVSGLPERGLKSMPVIPLTFSASKDSAGLELVDIFLWLFKRRAEKKSVATELLPIIRSLFYRSNTEEISLEAIKVRWTKWFQELPDVSEASMLAAKEIINRHEKERLKAIKKT